ncbi:hypothetical protein, partial [Streptomyces sp. Wh19]|uniref:hypothetical protein n=1 Tax=Streptomyces sp. Wh19 TaxID=3076629 RepID=UPI00295845D5
MFQQLVRDPLADAECGTRRVGSRGCPRQDRSPADSDYQAHRGHEDRAGQHGGGQSGGRATAGPGPPEQGDARQWHADHSGLQENQAEQDGEQQARPPTVRPAPGAQ